MLRITTEQYTFTSYKELLERIEALESSGHKVMNFVATKSDGIETEITHSIDPVNEEEAGAYEIKYKISTLIEEVRRIRAVALGERAQAMISSSALTYDLGEKTATMIDCNFFISELQKILGEKQEPVEWSQGV